MNHLIRVLISVILITAVVPCVSQTITETPIKDVDVNTVRDLIEEDETVIVLDVRTPEEYAMGHIEGTLNINIAEADFSERVSKLDRDKTYIIHCSANVKNGRSAKSIKIMTTLGFDKLLNMVGGINAWEQNVQPLVRNELQ